MVHFPHHFHDPNFSYPNNRAQHAADPIDDSGSRSAISLIPVTLSERGFRAIEGAGIPGLTQDFLKNSIPVHSRKVHKRDNFGKFTETAVSYSPNGEVSNVIQV